MEMDFLDLPPIDQANRFAYICSFLYCTHHNYTNGKLGQMGKGYHRNAKTNQLIIKARESLRLYKPTNVILATRSQT